jgi:hypothetical protein
LAHLVVANLMKKNGAIPVKNRPAASWRFEIFPGKKPALDKMTGSSSGEGNHCRGQNFPDKKAHGRLEVCQTLLEVKF